MTQPDLFSDLPAAPRKLEDFGEKLTGARKELWKTPAVPTAPAPATLAAQLPEPDYEQAAADGTPWENLAAVKAIRDAFPGRPTLQWKLEAWLDLAARARADFAALLDGTATAAAVILRWHGSVPERFALYRDLGFPACLNASGWRVATGTIGAGTRATIAVFGNMAMASAEGLGADARLQMLDYIRQQTAAGGKKAAPVAFSVYQNRGTGKVFIGKKAGGEVIPLKEGFANLPAAFGYLKDHRAELEAQWAALKAPALRRSGNEPRRGPARLAVDATPGFFLQTFGFRGVQFGNWVEPARRQTELNETSAALLDLAAALGLSADCLGFGGQLGLAFGARGHGKDMAHYERGRAVINLTKTRGPGCLAHEWFHALDNFSQPDPEAMATEAAAGPFAPLARVLTASPFAARSRALDAVRGKRYYGTVVELAARAFEKYVTDKLAALDISNDYLANLDKNSKAYPTDEEMAGGLAEAFDNLFASLKAQAGRA